MRERITITIRSDVLKKLDTIIDGEKIRNRSNAIETIVLEKFKHQLLRKAIILGADDGVKIGEKIIPKILLPLGEKTLLEKNIAKLKEVGVEEIILVAGKWRKAFEDILNRDKSLGVDINCYEKTDGTAAVLRNLKHELGGTFFMMNGDILLETIDIEDMFQFHKKYRGAGTVGVTAHRDPADLGSIYMRGNGIRDFREKTKQDHSLMVNAGVYILEASVCDLVPEGFSMIENDVFPKLAKEGKLFGYQVGEKWVHLHDEAHYKRYLETLKMRQ